MPDRNDDRRFQGPPGSKPPTGDTPVGEASGMVRRLQADTEPGETGKQREGGVPFDRSHGTRRSMVSGSIPEPGSSEQEGPQDSLIPRVELPRGGGAIRGIGETFEANAFTGTGTLTIPVPLSPARALTPELELSYDSGRGNGPFGLGWALSVPDIVRRTDRGLPRYADGPKKESDTFVLAGAEDLVPLMETGQNGLERVSHDTDTHRVYPYRPRVESAFSRIERWVAKSDGSVHWRVTSRDQVTSVLGETAQARVSNPARPKFVYRWLLERQYDDRGNEVHYIYKQEDLEGVQRGALPEKERLVQQPEQPQRYLKRILYGNRITAPENVRDFAFEVVLDYGEHGEETSTSLQVDITPEEIRPWLARLDPFSSYRSRFDIRTRRLCRRILVFHRIEALSGETTLPRLVRSLDLEYDEQPHVSLLTGATMRGYSYDEQTGHYTVESLPPVTLGYAPRTLGQRLEDVDPRDLADVGGAVGGKVRVVDLDSEGIPGLLVEGHAALYYKRAAGEGRYHFARPLPTRPTVASQGPGSVRVMDIDGSGRMSVVQRRAGLPSGFWRRDALAEDWEAFREFAEIPTIGFDDPRVHFVDLDGDGIADFLYDQGPKFLWWASRGADGWGQDYDVGIPMDENAGPQMVYNDPKRAVLFADMTGDGLLDIVGVENGSVCYWPNLGYGKFGRKITMEHAPWFEEPDQFDTRWLRVFDIDGTGPSDLVYFDGRGARVWFNEAGNGFSAPVTLSQFPAPHTMAHLEVADLLGRGTACLLWSSPLAAEQRLRYLDLFPGGKPYLLNRVENNLGLETRVRYTSSTQFYLADRAAGKPWATRLPFPVQVIDRVEVVDHARGHRFVSTYTYHHGYFDGPEREFRGFGRVEQRDTESVEHFGDPVLFPTGHEVVDEALHVPPVVTTMWFHTGAYLAAESLTKQYEKEYWWGDANAPAPLATTLPPTGLRGDECREALRALRGKPLRTEVYAEDGSEAADRPYQVTEHAYALRLEQKKFPKHPTKLEEGRHHGIFFVHERETRSYHYERDLEDPRFVQTLVLAVDVFGNVLRSAEIAYPRRTPTGPAADEQSAAKIVISETDWINQNGAMEAIYRLGTPIETRSFELTGFAAPDLQNPWTAEDLDTMVGEATVFDFEEAPAGPAPHMRRLERSQIRYWNDALTAPLPHGEVGIRALVYEAWAMAFTAAHIAEVLEGRLGGAALQDVLEEEGRYLLHEGAWWTRSERAVFDDDQFFLPVTVADPFGNETSIVYDAARLLVVQVTDAAGNTVHAEHDYRVLQPALITDPNQNRSFAAYDALGRATAIAIGGKAGETAPERQGDTLEHPTQWFEYHPFAWVEAQTPAFVHAFAREQYFPVDPNAPIQESVTYSDGAGNVLMEKVLAEPGEAPARDSNGELVFANGELVYTDTSPNPRWVGTGRVILDNKGNPVKQYEPFFSDRPDWEREEELIHFGVTPILHYDPLGRLVRTDYPDGTLERVEFSPWQTVTWDRNDTVLESDWYAERNALPGGTPDEAAEKRAAALTEAHAATPTVTHQDVLGRDVVVVAHLRDEGDPAPDRFVETRTVLDISGNLLAVIDARGNTAQRNVYGLLGQVLHTASADAGERWMLDDVAGAPLRVFDGLGRRHRFQYDALRRLTHHWVQPAVGDETLVLLNVWGEIASPPEENNLRGQLLRQYDGAGLLENARFHFAGYLLEQQRRLALTYTAVPDWRGLAGAPTLADLDTAAASLLEAALFTTETTYDALGRPITRTTPDASVTRYAYNRGGLLATVEAELHGATPTTPFVADIAYDVYGRRAAVAHGNGTRTEYTYDPRAFRLRRIHTTRARPASGQQALLDLHHTYDPVGNLVAVRNEADDTVYFQNTAIDPHQEFEYDTLYRLSWARGREHAVQNNFQRDATDFDPIIHFPNSPEALQRYEEDYVYDSVGNLLSLAHTGGPTLRWKRCYQYAQDGNRLLATGGAGELQDPSGVCPAHYPAAPTLSQRYDYDAHGNMIRMPHLAAIDWDYADRLQHADLGGGGEVYFQYDAAGSRIRKIRINQSGTQANERLYLGGFERYCERDVEGGALSGIHLERETLHIADDTGRIVLVETLTVEDGEPITSPANVARYQYGNHLDSVFLELDAAANVISYEEYHPYGTTAYQAGRSAAEVSLKRYRYTGQERDEETGLYHMGARYYAAWLGRWTSGDPIGLGDGVNRYAYVHGNPATMRDPSGTQGVGGWFSEQAQGLVAKGQEVAAEVEKRIDQQRREDVQVQRRIERHVSTFEQQLRAADAERVAAERKIVDELGGFHPTGRVVSDFEPGQVRGPARVEDLRSDLRRQDTALRSAGAGRTERIQAARETYLTAAAGIDWRADYVADVATIESAGEFAVVSVALGGARSAGRGRGDADGGGGGLRKGDPLPDEAQVHRIGGGQAENLALKEAEKKLKPPGFSTVVADTAEAARTQMLEAFPNASRLQKAAETVGTATAKDIRAAGFDVVHQPTRHLPSHARVIHPAGAEGFSQENLEELAKKFVNVFFGSGGAR
jgi:RHS repeat-associated protein